MANIVSIFNNKGGVGKTTYLYHIAHLLADRGKKVLMVDCDSQCNLSAYSLSDETIKKSWAEDGNSIFKQIEPVFKTTGDIRSRKPTRVINTHKELYIIPGDLFLSDYEDRLGDTWNGAKGGNEADLRAQSAIYRVIKDSAKKVKADIVLIDLGPNLGALNRAVIAGSDCFITPVAPDLFSIQGTKNLGNKLVRWRQEWEQCNASWHGDIEIPKGRPTYLGYVIQQHNQRTTATQMTRGWSIYKNQLEPAIRGNIVEKLEPVNQVAQWDDDNYQLGLIPNLHSMIPYSLNAKKPIFHCNSTDGLNGSHISKARDSEAHFHDVVEMLEHVIESEAWQS